jgi:hypothetical protein
LFTEAEVREWEQTVLGWNIEEFVGTASLIADVTVTKTERFTIPEKVYVHPKKEMVRAWLALRGPVLKGIWPGLSEDGMVPVSFSWHPPEIIHDRGLRNVMEGDSFVVFLRPADSEPRPYFETGDEYVHVLDGKEAGTIESRDFEGPLKDFVLEAIKKDTVYEEIFKHLVLQFSISPTVMGIDEEPRNSLVITNGSEHDLRIPARLESAGCLISAGWSRLHIEASGPRVFAPAFPKDRFSHYVTEELVVPAGQSVVVGGRYEPTSSEQKPGRFEYTFSLGRVKSNTVVIERVEE